MAKPFFVATVMTAIVAQLACTGAALSFESDPWQAGDVCTLDTSYSPAGYVNFWSQLCVKSRGRLGTGEKVVLLTDTPTQRNCRGAGEYFYYKVLNKGKTGYVADNFLRDCGAEVMD